MHYLFHTIEITNLFIKPPKSHNFNLEPRKQRASMKQHCITNQNTQSPKDNMNNMKKSNSSQQGHSKQQGTLMAVGGFIVSAYAMADVVGLRGAFGVDESAFL